MRYGRAFKDYLLRTFRLRGMIGFQSQVFPDVLVRPVLILAEKRPVRRAPGRSRVAFVSLNGRAPKALPLEPCRLLEHTATHASGTIVRMDELQPAQNWTPLLYAPAAYVELLKQPSMTPLASLAQVRIGLQSFAKMFYIVPRETQRKWALEHRWLRPMIMSPKDVAAPILTAETSVRHYVLACNWLKENLTGTCLLRYIQYWEAQVLNPRGRARPVIGVQNLPRLRKTRRTPWYNLLDDLNRRGTAPVLMPRRIYQRYQVVWNQVGERSQVRIGLQSFAKMFYIVPRETQRKWALEHRWLRPMIMSPKDVAAPILTAETSVRHYVLACNWRKENILANDCRPIRTCACRLC